MPLYSIEVPICATAYIEADNPEEARKKAERLKGACLVLQDAGGSTVPISGLRFDDPDLPKISLSPAMTVMPIEPNTVIDLAH